MRNFLKSKKKVSKLVKQISNIICIRFPTLYMQFYTPPPFFSTHIHTPLLQLCSSIFYILCLFCIHVYLYTYRLPPSFNLMIPVQKGPRFTYAPPPFSLSFSSSLGRFFFLCLSVCLCLSLSLTRSLALSLISLI